jgi:acetylornithine deacetylase/succinyl-diaminopimelate desuccinylase-like protein
MDEKLRELIELVDTTNDELVELHQELVQIETVNTGAEDSGNETALCKVLQRRLAKEGIAAEIYESRPGRGNLVATIGEGERNLLLMSHTDVVPVVEAAWTYDVPPRWWTVSYAGSAL